MHLYRAKSGPVVVKDGHAYPIVDSSWEQLVVRDDLLVHLEHAIARVSRMQDEHFPFLAPIGDGQEVWAAGVTYFRSRDARMEESAEAGGGNFYDRVYSAARPELFFKATPHRVVGSGQPVRIRRDSKWNVPEPELALVIAPSGKIIGYTIGNDMSSRDIEGENPLYLPQAKVYDGCCALGPGILLAEAPPAPTTAISLTILRDGQACFVGQTSLASLKRDPRELVEYLFRECTFPHGCILLTGTGVIPPMDFTLQVGDVVKISIDGIGTLTNPVATG